MRSRNWKGFNKHCFEMFRRKQVPQGCTTNILGSGTCHRDGYLFSRDWYKERYQFSQFWYKERYRFSRFFYEIKCRIYYFEKIGIRSGILFQKIGIRTSIFLKPRWHIPDQNLVECTPPPPRNSEYSKSDNFKKLSVLAQIISFL